MYFGPRPEPRRGSGRIGSGRRQGCLGKRIDVTAGGQQQAQARWPLWAMIFLAAAPSVAAGETETVLAGGDRPVILGDLAAADNIGVVWHSPD